MPWWGRLASTVCCHPALLIFVFAVACGALNRLRKLARRDVALLAPPVERLNSGVVCVVVVVPSGAAGGAAAEALQKARHPHCLRIHVVKAATATEVPPRLEGADQLSVRVHMARARGFDAAVARLTTLRREYADEAFVCTLPHDVELAQDWDATLIALLRDCEERSPAGAAVTAQLLPSGHGTFMRVRAFGAEGAVRTEAVPYAEPPARCVPSAFVWCRCLFMRGALVAALPRPAAVRCDLEDVVVGQSLWTHGVDFYTPPAAVGWSREEALVGPCRTVAAAVAGPARSTLEHRGYMGTLRNQVSRRARLGLTPRASNLEIIAKYGHVNVLEQMDEEARARRRKSRREG